MSKIKEETNKFLDDVANNTPNTTMFDGISFKEIKKGTCGCGRSPTGNCIGWHNLTEEKYKEKKKYYESLNETQKKTAFHPKAIDGFGE